jgi:amidase
VTAAEYLEAVEDLQRFSRTVARFLTTVDLWLTPTLSTPPPPLGVIASTAEEPWQSLRTSGQTIRYAGVVANLAGNPAMSVPLWWNGEDIPIGVHFLARYGDEATLLRLASQLEQARPWRERRPPTHAVAIGSSRRSGA